MAKTLKTLIKNIYPVKLRKTIIFKRVKLVELTKRAPLCKYCEDRMYMGAIAWGKKPLTPEELNLNISLAKAGELYLCQEDQKYIPKDKPAPTKTCELLD